MTKAEHFRLVWGLGLLLGLLACRPEPYFDQGPRLSFAGLSHDTIRSHVDTLTLYLAYEDPNGDLGALHAEETPLWIKDSRLPGADHFYVQPLAPIHSTVWIKGTLAVHIPKLFVLSNAGAEDVFFSASIQDRASNWSNVAVSEKVVVVR